MGCIKISGAGACLDEQGDESDRSSSPIDPPPGVFSPFV